MADVRTSYTELKVVKPKSRMNLRDLRATTVDE